MITGPVVSTTSTFLTSPATLASLLKKRDKDRKAFFKDTIEEVIGDDANSDNRTLWEKKLEEIENNK